MRGDAISTVVDVAGVSIHVQLRSCLHAELQAEISLMKEDLCSSLS